MFFQLANIQWISKTSYYEIQKKISRHSTLNYVQYSKQILMIMAGDDKEGVTVSSVKMVDVTARDIMRNT